MAMILRSSQVHVKGTGTLRHPTVWRTDRGARSPLRAALAFAVVMLLSFACAKGEEPPASPSPATSAGAATPHPTKVADLVAAPQTSFDVEFEWDQGDVRGPRRKFSWRQGGGVRRRDAQLTGDTGSLVIETGFSGTSLFGSRTLGCDWFRPPDADEVRIACLAQTASLRLLSDALDAALQTGGVRGAVAGRQIAGAQAVCYAFDAVASGEICTDGKGVPLYFKGAFRDGLPVQTIEAIQVSRDGAAPVIPEDLPFTDIPYKIGPSYPLTKLHLPDWSDQTATS